MRYLFSSPVTPDYLHPLIGLAIELRERGHEVAFVTGETADPLLETLAIPRVGPRRRDAETFRLQPWPMPRFVDAEVRHVEQALRELIPDMLIAPVIGVSALIVHDRARVPLCLMSAAEDVGIGPDSVGLVNDLRATFGLAAARAPASRFPLTGDLFLLRSVPALEMDLEALPPEVRFVGACEWEPPVAAERTQAALAALRAAESAPTLYVYSHRHSLDEPKLWPCLVDAFGFSAVHVVATIAPWDYDPRVLPPNFTIWNSFPRAAVLPRASLAISTSKSSAPLAALAHGVPSLLVAAPRWDGGEHAARFVRAGCAVRVEAGLVTPAALQRAVTEALQDERLRENARRVGAEFARMPNFRAAADSIESHVLAGDDASLVAPLAARL